MPSTSPVHPPRALLRVLVLALVAVGLAATPAAAQALTVQATDGDDVITIGSDGTRTTYRIGSGPTVAVADADAMVVEGGHGDDTMVIDASWTAGRIPITFHGGDNVTSTGDGIDIRVAASSMESRPTSPDSGTIELDGTTITYTGLEPIAFSGTTDLTVNFPATAVTDAVLADAAPAGSMEITASAFEDTTFTVPTSSLTINMANGHADVLDLTGLDAAWDADLIVVGEADDQVTATGTLDLGAGSLDLAAGEVVVDAATVSTTGTGTVAIDGDDTVTLVNGSTVSAEDGDITVSANVGGSTVGTVDDQAVHVSGGSITTTGSGGIRLEGVAQASATGNAVEGVRVSNGATVDAAGTGAVTIVGTSGSGAGSNHGVTVTGGATAVTAADGGITLQGRGGGSTGQLNTGVLLLGGATVSTTGTGPVLVDGVGGDGTNANRGVEIGTTGSSIRTVGGSITILAVGNAASTGVQNDGIAILDSSEVTSTTGRIEIQATAGSGTGTNRGIAVLSASTIRSGGDVVMTTTPGAATGNNNDGIRLASATVESTGADVTLTGVASPANGLNQGLRALTSTAVSAAGTLQVTGTGATGQDGDDNIGVRVDDTSTLTGLTDLVITGTGVDAADVVIDHGGQAVGPTIQVVAGTNGLITEDGVGGGHLVGDAAITGTLAPGASPGQVGVTGDLTLDGSSTLAVEVDGLVAGTSYDQVVVTGDVDVTGAALDVDLDGALDPAVGTTFTIIDNQGVSAVTGTFADLPEGQTFTVGSEVLAISYAGGDGNDVVLTVADVPTISVAATTTSAAEGDSGTTTFTFTASRSGTTTGTTDVDWAVTGGTVDAADLGGALPSGTASFAAGASSTTFTVEVSGDTDLEPDETIVVEISSPTNGAVLSATTTASATVLNDEDQISITADAADGPEGTGTDTPFTFTVSRDNTIGAATVDWAVTGDVDDADFVGGLPSGTVAFADAEGSQTVTVTPVSDGTVEPDEVMTVTLSAPSAGSVIIGATASSTVLNDDVQTPTPTPTVTATPTETPTTDPTEPGEPGGSTPEADRIAGASRVETAVLAAAASHPDGAATVVLARSDEYADALVGAPLAHLLDAPILLTGVDALPEATATAIADLGADAVVILGGTTAVGAEVEEALSGMGLDVERISGQTRFETAGLVADRIGGDHVFVVEGIDDDPTRGWPDAVAVGHLAASTGSPILLVSTDHLPDPTVRRLGGRATATVVGGTASVGELVMSDIGLLVGSVDRVAGPDRYATSALVADLGRSLGLTAEEVWLARGDDWVDALAAGPAVAAAGAVFLLVAPTDLVDSPATADWVSANAADVDRIVVMGGPDAVAEAVVEALLDLLG